MSHLFRFLGKKSSAGSWQIEGEEVHHLAKVLRLKAGDPVEVFDGLGAWCVGALTHISKDLARVDSSEEFAVEARSGAKILAVGALKPGDFDEVIAPLVELGMDQFWVYMQEHVAKDRLNDKVKDRWQRIVLSAAKQCKRPFLPEIKIFSGVEALIDGAIDLCPQKKLLLSPAGNESLLTQCVGADSVLSIIGGEKGFSPNEETKLIESGFKPVTLGKNILRAWTAAVAAAAIMASVN